MRKPYPAVIESESPPPRPPDGWRLWPRGFKWTWPRRCWVIPLIWLLVLASAWAQAEPPTVYLVLEPKQATHQAFQAAFLKHSQRLIWGIKLQTGPLPLPAERFSLIVAVGASACHEALAATDSIPIVCTLTPRQAVHSALTAHPGPATALYLDQPFARQAALVALVLPRARRIGSLFGPVSAAERQSLKVALTRQGLQLRAATFVPGDNLVQTLNRLLTEIDVLLAVPDPAIFSAANIYPLLLSAYYHQIPLIGYSGSFVEAGALAAVYSEPAQIGQQTAELLDNWLKQEEINLPPPQEPRYFTVRVNRQLARSLAIEMPDEATLARRLATLEQGAAP